MRDAVTVPVTVKCRIGVDDQTPEIVLPDFLRRVRDAGVTRVAIHARKAWLHSLSPKENRDIPPLDYDLVHAMKAAFPNLYISINGGIEDLAQAQDHLARGLDGVMIGRAAYHTPWDTLARADARIFGQSDPCETPHDAAEAMIPYIEAHIASGGRLHNVTRHMLGLFQGRPGARAWRGILSTDVHGDGAGVEVLENALAQVPRDLAA